MTHAERMAEIKAREAAATKGPWNGATDPSHFDADCVDSSEWSMYVERRNDRDFIAHARADIPYLLARVEAMEAALREAREAMRKNLVYYAVKDEPALLAAINTIDALEGEDNG